MTFKLKVSIVGIALMLLTGCSGKEFLVDVTQTCRDKDLKISDQVHTINTDTLLIGGSTYIYANNKFLFIVDVRPTEECEFVTVFDAKTLEHKGEFGKFGPAPTEILMPGGMYLNDSEGCVYIPDNAQWKILKYNVAEAIRNQQYEPAIKQTFVASGVPYGGTLVNDSLIVCEIVRINSDNTSTCSVGRLNLLTGEMSELAPSEKWPKYSRPKCVVALDNSFIVEAGGSLDLMKIYNMDGTVKRRIKGPAYKEPVDRDDPDQLCEITVTNDYILALYSGTRDFGVEKLLVFDHDGEYLATLHLGRGAIHMAYSPALNRLFMSVDDENAQFAYLDLDGVKSLMP